MCIFYIEINVSTTSNAKLDGNARTGRGPAQCIEMPSLSRHPIPDFVRSRTRPGIRMQWQKLAGTQERAVRGRR